MALKSNLLVLPRFGRVVL